MSRSLCDHFPLHLLFSFSSVVAAAAACSVRYFGMLEEKFGRHVGGTADMLVMLCFGILNIWVLDKFVLPPQYFYGPSLVYRPRGARASERGNSRERADARCAEHSQPD